MNHILHISRTMDQGGAEKIVEQLCCDIKNQKFTVASTGGYRIDSLKKHCITHYKIPDIASKNPIAIIRTLNSLNNIIRTEHINIIHSHHRMAAFYAQILKTRYPKIRLIYTAHNIYTDKKALSHFSFKHTRIIACGKSVEKNLTDFYKIPKERITTIINSVKPPKLHKINILPQKEKGQIYLASISRLVKDKGIDIFIDALNIVKQKNTLNFHAFIIGDGDERINLEHRVKELNLQSNITFLGFQKAALSIIQPVDMIVFPSRREGLPLTLMELLTLNKPIIASNIESHKEIMGAAHNRLFFSSNSSQDLAKKISTLTTKNYSSSTNLKENGRKYLIHYNYFLKQYDSIYNEATKEQKGAAI